VKSVIGQADFVIPSEVEESVTISVIQEFCHTPRTRK